MRIVVKDNVSLPMKNFMAGLRNRRPMNVIIGKRVQSLVRKHVIAWASSHHDTAAKLGASQTGFVGRAAEAVGRGSAMKADATGATLSLNHPFFARAFRDVTIKPGPGLQYLALPMIGFAYGKRAYRMPGLFFKNGCLARKSSMTKSLLYVYSLVESVLQKKERARLPDDARIMAEAVEGIKDYAKYLRSKQGGAVA